MLVLLHTNHIYVFIKLCRCESRRYLLPSCEFDNPKEWGGIDLLYLAYAYRKPSIYFNLRYVDITNECINIVGLFRYAFALGFISVNGHKHHTYTKNVLSCVM